jgi:hypothetical protein
MAAAEGRANQEPGSSLRCNDKNFLEYHPLGTTNPAFVGRINASGIQLTISVPGTQH